MNKLNWVLVGAVLLALASFGYFVYDYINVAKVQSSYETIEYVTPTPQQMEVGAEFRIISCQVVDGHIFLMQLENGQRHECKLSIVTKEEATPEVVKLLKTAISPTVVLRRKIGSYWVVDFNLTVGDRRITLVEWLEGAKLIL